MTTVKNLGIWMDHASAHLTEYTEEAGETKTITSQFTHEAKEFSLSKSENLMHKKEQHQQSEYYKRLGEEIRNYGEVILFGPTSAKTELLNILRADHRYEKIKIGIQQTDKMTQKQQQAFVTEYFAKE
jgi:hypothetical protein